METNKKGKAMDRHLISLEQKHERRYWREKFGVSGQQLAAAVRAVGHGVKNVQAYLDSRK